MFRKMLKCFLENNLNKTKIKNNKFVFMNLTKSSYGCSPKYIAEEILNQNLPCELVWLVRNPNVEKKNFPNGIRLVKFSSIKALFELASAKFWVTNSRMNYYLKKGLTKKDEQKYIQTWHGSLGFKKIENDLAHNPSYSKYLEVAQNDTRMIDCLLSPSSFDTECLKKCFNYDGPILEFGYPRNDLFFYSDEKKAQIQNKVRKYYNIPNDKKILLYVPTFRDSHDMEQYNIDVDKLLATLKEKFGSDWVILSRLHPNLLRKSKKLSQLLKNTINVTAYPDVQELSLASDILITDYSSVIWDFCLQDKPAYIFATDIEEYTKERDFYIPIMQMPFVIAQNNEELLSGIANCKVDEYILNQKEFMKNVKGHFDAGKASEKVVEIIKKDLGDE